MERAIDERLTVHRLKPENGAEFFVVRGKVKLHDRVPDAARHDLVSAIVAQGTYVFRNIHTRGVSGVEGFTTAATVSPQPHYIDIEVRLMGKSLTEQMCEALWERAKRERVENRLPLRVVSAVTLDGDKARIESLAFDLAEKPALDHGDEVKQGDVWSIDGASWTVVGPEKDGVTPLQGPGPCRGMRYERTFDILVGGRLVLRR